MTAGSAATLRRAADLLMLGLAAPPVVMHGLAFAVEEVGLSLGSAAQVRELAGWLMPLAFLLLATPLHLLAYPGATRLVQALPGAPRATWQLRGLVLALAALTVGSALARAGEDLPLASRLLDAAVAARLAAGLAVATRLWASKAPVPRPVLGATAATQALALLLHLAVALGAAPDRLPPALPTLRGLSALTLALALLLLRRAA